MNNEVREKKPWPSYVASFLLNDMTGACKKRKTTFPECGISPFDISYLLQLNYDDHIDRKTARQSLEFMLDEVEKRRAEVADFLEHVRQRLVNE